MKNEYYEFREVIEGDPEVTLSRSLSRAERIAILADENRRRRIREFVRGPLRLALQEALGQDVLESDVLTNEQCRAVRRRFRELVLAGESLLEGGVVGSRGGVSTLVTPQERMDHVWDSLAILGSHIGPTPVCFFVNANGEDAGVGRGGGIAGFLVPADGALIKSRGLGRIAHGPFSLCSLDGENGLHLERGVSGGEREAWDQYWLISWGIFQTVCNHKGDAVR